MCRLIGLHLYEGLFKIVPLESDGKFQEEFNVRLDELQIIDMCFLHGNSTPTLCVLFEDPKQRRHVKTYKVVLSRKELVEGPWSQPNVESGASMLIPVPTASGGGVLILGQQSSRIIVDKIQYRCPPQASYGVPMEILTRMVPGIC